MDPVITGARPTRNYAYLVFDTLYGIDTEWKAQPQMVEGHTGAAWLNTVDLEEQKRICVDLQKQLWEDVPFIPIGEYCQATAFRKHLADILPGCFATFYGVRRA